MADNVKITVEGDKELVAALQNLHQEAVLIAAQEAAMAGALRLRTRLRRAAPVGKNSKSRIKAGWPRLSEVMKAKGGDSAPIAWAGMIGRAPYFYKTLDVGRKAFKRYGKPVAGSPPSNPWWAKAVASASGEVKEVMMRKLASELRKRISSVISNYNAPIRFR